MKRYTLEELANADVYEADRELETLARKVARQRPGGYSTENIRLALAGGMAEHVFKELTKACNAADAKRQRLLEDEELMRALSSMKEWTFVFDGDHVDFRGPHGDAVTSLLRRKGEWVASEGLWRVRLDGVATVAKWLRASGRGTATDATRGELEELVALIEREARSGRIHHVAVNECRVLSIADFEDLHLRLKAVLAASRLQASATMALRVMGRARKGPRYPREKA